MNKNSFQFSGGHHDTKTYGGQSNAGASLAMNQATQTSLALDDAIGDSHLAAQSRQEQNDLRERVNEENFTSIFQTYSHRNQLPIFVNQCGKLTITVASSLISKLYHHKSSKFA